MNQASLTLDNNSLESAGPEPASPEAPLADSPPVGDGAVLWKLGSDSHMMNVCNTQVINVKLMKDRQQHST